MNWFILLILGLIFIISPYDRGLYFDRDLYSIQLVIFGLFIMLYITLLVKKETDSIKPIWVIMILPFFYLISLIGAESPIGAWNSLLRWIGYTAFFILLYWAARKERKIKYLLPFIFQVTGIWIAIHMLLNEFGWMEFSSAFIFNRFAGVFQYPNTLSAVMGMYFLFSIFMLLHPRLRAIHKIIYGIPLVIFLVTFIETYSRGMLLILPIMWFSGLLLLRQAKQLSYIVYTLMSLIASILGVFSLQSDLAWLFLLILSVGIALFIHTYDKFLQKDKMNNFVQKISSKRVYRLVVPVLIVVMALLLLMDFGFKGFVYQQLPGDLQERISSMSGSASARERTLFVQDSFKISMDAPLFGHGGDAWEPLYRSYQQLPYQANKIHNEYMEFAVDIGWIGLVFFIAVIGYFFFIIFRSYQDEQENMIFPAILIASFTILFHSFIDFDLAFGTVCFMLLWLLVMGLTYQKVETVTKNNSKMIPRYFSYAFVTLVLVGVFMSYQFMNAEQSFRKANSVKNPYEKINYLSEAVEKNSYNYRYLLRLASLRASLAEQNHDVETNTKNVIQLSNRIVELEPNNAFLYSQVSRLLEDINELELADEYVEMAMDLDPYGLVNYETHMSINLKRASIENNILEKEAILHTVVETYRNLVEQVEETLSLDYAEYHNSRDFHLSEEAMIYAAEAGYLLNDSDLIRDILTHFKEPGEGEQQVVYFLLSTLERLNKNDERGKLVHKYQAVYPNLFSD
ncbi:O-antigen ligase family protein [Oceanobacillus sp. CAU 1775]